jgi:hypothetical protein
MFATVRQWIRRRRRVRDYARFKPRKQRDWFLA